MNDYSWDNPDLQLICGECHFKDKDPMLCHGVKPPIKKTFIPNDVSSCSFIRESYWERIPKEKQDEIDDFIKKRSERYYKKENI